MENTGYAAADEIAPAERPPGYAAADEIVAPDNDDADQPAPAAEPESKAAPAAAAATEAKEADLAKACVTDWGRNVWTSYYETDAATHGRGIEMTPKLFKVPKHLLGTKDFEDDLEVLRQYFSTCELQADGQIKLGAVLNGQFLRARNVAQLSLVFHERHFAIHVFENAATHRETIYWYLKPKGEPNADWKKAKPADAVVVREHELAPKLSALLRDWRRRYSALSWLGNNISWALADLAILYGATQPALPRQVMCLDTASDVFGHLWTQNLMIAITNTAVTDLDNKNAAAVARRNAPLYALLVTIATCNKPRA
jgi:hypothetical protein